MKTVLLVVLLVMILCASVLGLFTALPFVKEGASWGDLPIIAGVAGAAFFLGLIWWLAVGRSFKKALVGWAMLLAPLLVHGSIAAALVNARFEGERLAKSVQIKNYQEVPIVWPGFDGPIGLQVTFELRHASGINATILPPEVRIGPRLDIPRDKLSSSLTSGSGYLKNTYLEEPAGDLTLLKTVLFQRVFDNSAGKNANHKWTAEIRIADTGSTVLTYPLLPGTVDFIPDKNRICLNSRSFGVALCSKGQKPNTGCASANYKRVTKPIYFKGHDLSALWIAAGAYDMIADLSDQLTTILRKHSRLQSNPVDWQAIQKRLEPEGLGMAGYKLCPAGKNSHTSFRTCYCKAI